MTELARSQDFSLEWEGGGGGTLGLTVNIVLFLKKFLQKLFYMY